MAAVEYVGLVREPDCGWDLGNVHWPEVGVELVTTEGETFSVRWDDQVTNFDLTLANGPMPDRESGWRRSWDVSRHPRWQPYLHAPVDDVSVITMDQIGDSPDPVPVAVRLEVSGRSVWIVEAQLRHRHSIELDLRPDNFFVGGDEVIVVFGDPGANAIGVMPS